MSSAAYFALRDDDLPGSGTITDPFNGSDHAVLDPKLDLLNPGTAIIFGPGVFRTKGYGAVGFGWRPKTGQRVVGAGMHSTILQLVDAQESGLAKTEAAPISTDLMVSDIEISDLTLDANLARQAKKSDGSNPKLTLSGINISEGTNIAVRRVRVINWGTYNENSECFPIYIASPWSAASSGANVVEDCIVEQPEHSNRREATLLNNHSHPNSASVLPQCATIT